MPHHTSLIALLCVGFVMAFALGMLARRLRLSPLVGYLLAGVLVGPFTPGFVADQTLAPQLAEVGVILLMFGVGLHFSLKDLMAVRAIALPGAIAQIAAATAMGWAMAHYWLGWSHAAGLVFGLALSVASTVVLLRALEDRRLLDTGKGRVAVGWLIVEDLAMVLALVLLPALGDHDGGAGRLGLALLLTLLKVGGFVALMLLVGRRLIPRLLEGVAGTGSRELFTLCVLAVAMGVAFGAAELFGVSFALGAFFAGMLLNESEFGHKAANDSLPLRDAFAVLFFVSVGMLFDPLILIEHPLHVLATLLIIVLGKSLAAWAIVRAFGKPNDTAFTIAASLAQIGEFSFILAGLGIALGLLPAEGRDLILAGALLSIVINPLLFAWLERRTARDAPRREDAAPLPQDLAGHVILVGYGRVGRHLAQLLRERGVPLVLVEADRERALAARAQGLATVHGNAADVRVLQEAHPERAHLGILAVPNALEAGEVVARMKAANPMISVLARAHSDTEVQHLLAHGADAAVLAERELAYSLTDMVMATPPYRAPRAAPPAA
ncbi:YbaL family putative K(+) efflux transporter [Thermomonas haemolytica]|uniref:Kef-type potassium/proton antiporter (CPA2 family) n=2 Tax=Thermomonas haemolytica TaxID=141949 RepID=A0A4R3NC46_9GAMM|nr:YbaL family putative K(+) efflux transporter [Thermomonas haemolytica]TCT24753.1 Kef-type potassium/proton antiporter (CPA2 family) [Thermomonas haemolytica]